MGLKIIQALLERNAKSAEDAEQLFFLRRIFLKNCRQLNWEKKGLTNYHKTNSCESSRERITVKINRV